MPASIMDGHKWTGVMFCCGFGGRRCRQDHRLYQILDAPGQCIRERRGRGGVIETHQLLPCVIRGVGHAMLGDRNDKRQGRVDGVGLFLSKKEIWEGDGLM